ncbi:antibiotic biosynthesis monooxygenase [Alcanivorax sp. KX64203]|nr:antibiotic biosynthesis monooxygenase [Alcanivorax sp. KX64203]
MSKVILKGYIVVPEPDLEAVKAELAEHIDATLREPGCLLFEVSQDASDRYRFNVHEIFSDNDAFERHQLRVRQSKWGEVSARAKRHYKISHR